MIDGPTYAVNHLSIPGHEISDQCVRRVQVCITKQLSFHQYHKSAAASDLFRR